MSRLSGEPAQRGLQVYVAAWAGWLIVGVVVVTLALMLSPQPASTSVEGRALGVGPLQLGLGAVFALIGLRLPVLVARHRLGALQTIDGLRSQYVAAGLLTGLLSAPAYLFFWWFGPAVTVLAAGSALVALTVRPDPHATTAAEPMLAGAREPTTGDRWMARHPVLFVVLLVGLPLVLVGVIIAVGMLAIAV